MIQDQITGVDNSVSFGQTKPLRSYKEDITIKPSDFDNYLKKIAKVFLYESDNLKGFKSRKNNTYRI